MKKAIVTLLIGEKFRSRWMRNAEHSWRSYCERHGYDLICFSERLDHSKRATERSPAWQKCLIFSLSEIQAYDRVVWLDSDIIISERAPDILEESIPIQRIGATDVFALQDSCDGSALSYYQNVGLLPFEQVVNTGVLIVSPKLHNEAFEYVYSTYEDSSHSHYEMIPLSYELIRQDLIHWIDPKFNHLVYDIFSHSYPFLLASNNTMSLITKAKRKLIRTLFCRLCLEAALKSTYFMHFAGYGCFLDERNFWGRLE